MANYIIDPVNDAEYYTEVRSLLGITVEILSDAVLKSDIFLGASERAICKVYVPNWQTVLTGSDQIAADALRSCVVIHVALNILNMPANQNIVFDKVQLIDVILTAKKQTLKEVRDSLETLFNQQLSFVGVEHAGAGWPDRDIVGKSGSVSVYDYYVDTNGSIESEI